MYVLNTQCLLQGTVKGFDVALNSARPFQRRSQHEHLYVSPHEKTYPACISLGFVDPLVIGTTDLLLTFLCLITS